jgi:hypothetical protein
MRSPVPGLGLAPPVLGHWKAQLGAIGFVLVLNLFCKERFPRLESGERQCSMPVGT